MCMHNALLLSCVDLIEMNNEYYGNLKIYTDKNSFAYYDRSRLKRKIKFNKIFLLRLKPLV